MSKKIQYENIVIDPETGLTEDILRTPSMSRASAYSIAPKTDVVVPELFSNGRSVYDKSLDYNEVISDSNAVEQNRHEEQPWYSSLGAAVVQTGTTLAGQTLQGIGYLLDPEQMINIARGAESEWNNQLAQWGDELIKAGQDIAPIYQDPDKQGGFNYGDWSWWMGNAPSVISTLSFFIPGAGVAKLASMAGKAIGIAKNLSKATRIIGKGIIGGLASRYMESSMEAAQTYQGFQDMIGAPLTAMQAKKIEEEYGVKADQIYNPETGVTSFTLSEEAAKIAGSKAAANNFKANSAMALVDIPQFIFATSPFGSVTKGLTKQVATALGKSGGLAAAKTVGAWAVNMLSEGAEEGYQYITNERSKDLELARMGLIDEEDLSSATKRYMNEGDFWTSAAFGALGAGVMKGAAQTYEKLKAKKTGEVSEDSKRVANINAWAAQMSAASKALADTEDKKNEYAFKRIQTDNVVAMGVEAAENGNLGHLVNLMEDAASDKEGTRKLLGLEDDKAFEAFKNKSSEMINTLKGLEEIYQSNINKTGHWGLAKIQTLSDVKVKTYTGLVNEINRDLESTINDKSNWTFDASVQSDNNLSQQFISRLSKESELKRLKQSRLELEKAIKDSVIAAGGKETFLSQALQRKLNIVESRLKSTEEVINSSKESYSDEQFKDDSGRIKLQADALIKLGQIFDEKVKAEINLADSQKDAEYYRSDEGKAMFDKARYDVKKKAIEKEVSDTKSSIKDVETAIEGDDTGAAKKAADKIAEKQADAVTDKPGEDDGLIEAAGLVSSVENGASVYNGNPQLANKEISKLKKSFPNFKELNEVETAEDFQELINDAIQNHNNGIPEATEFLEAYNKIIKARKAASRSRKAKEAPIVQQAQTEEVDEIKDEIGVELADEFDYNASVSSIVPTTTGDMKKTDYAGLSDARAMLQTYNGNGDILPGVDFELLKKFDIQPNEPVYIALDNTRYQENNPNDRRYVLVIKRGNKTHIIGVLPRTSDKSLNDKTERPIIAGLRGILNDYYSVPGNDKVPGTSRANKLSFMDGKDGNPIPVTRVVGYTAHYNSNVVDGKSVKKSIDTNTIKKNTNDSKIGVMLKKLGGFVIGYVNHLSTNTVGINTPNVKIQTGDDKIQQKSIASRRDISNKLLSEQKGSDKIEVSYIMPYNEQMLIKKIPNEQERNKYISDNYVVTETFNNDELEYAQMWINRRYESETSGHVYVMIQNPMNEDDVLLMRAFYNQRKDLSGAAKERVEAYIEKIFSGQIPGVTSGMAVIRELDSVFVLSSNDKEILNEAIGKVSNIATVGKDMISGKSNFGWVPKILNTMTIRISADKSMNTAEGWNGGVEHPILGGDNVPFNEAVAPFVTTYINQSEPLTRIQPKIDLNRVASVRATTTQSNAKEVKQPVNSQPKQKVVTIADMLGSDEQRKEVDKNSVTTKQPVSTGEAYYPIEYVEDLKNADGTKRLAESHIKTKTIRINKNVTVEEFFKYIEGLDSSKSSLQKAKVFEALKAKGLDFDMEMLIDTPEDVKEFLYQHEKSHLDNNDEKDYWKNGQDFLTEDKIAIELRATEDALNYLRNKRKVLAGAIVKPKAQEAPKTDVKSNNPDLDFSAGISDMFGASEYSDGNKYTLEDAIMMAHLEGLIDKEDVDNLIKNNAGMRLVDAYPGDGYFGGVKISDKLSNLLIALRGSGGSPTIVKGIPVLSQSEEKVTNGSPEELAWFKKYFPNITVGQLDEIKDMVREVTKAGYTAWGAYYNAAIYLKDKFPEGTVYHEAFHVVFRLALSPEEQRTLLSQAEGSNEIEREEWLADKFSEILLSKDDKITDKSIKGIIARTFRKLKMFLRSIWNNPVRDLYELAYRVERSKYVDLSSNRFDDKNVRLYKRIEGWSWAKAKEAVDTINAATINLAVPSIRAIAVEKTINGEVVNTYPFNALTTTADVINAYIKFKGGNKFALYEDVYKNFKAALNKGTLTQSQSDNLSELMSKMFVEEIVDGAIKLKPQKLVLSSLEELANNNDMVLTVRGIDGATATIEDFVKTFDDEQERQSEVYDVNFVSKGHGNNVTPRVKNFIRYIPKGTTNSFGMQAYYDFNSVDNALLKDISGSMTRAELIKKLTKQLRFHPEYANILRKIQSDSAFATDLLMAYGRPLMDYKYIYTTKNGEVRINQANKGGVTNALKNAWLEASSNGTLVTNRNADGTISVRSANASILLGRLNKILPQLVSDEPISDNVAVELINILNGIGVSGVTVQAIQKIHSTKPVKSKIDIYNYGVRDFINQFALGKNPFQQTDGKSSHKFLRVFPQAVNDATPDMYESSHMSISGEKVYSHIIPQFLSIFLHNVHNLTDAIALIDNYSRDTLYADRVSMNDNGTVVENVVFYNPILQKIYDTIKGYRNVDPETLDIGTVSMIESQLKDIISIGLVEGESGDNRKEYAKMSDRDLKKNQLNMYYNNGNISKAEYKTIPLSDSPNMLSVLLSKMDVSKGMNGALKQLVKIATGEYNRIQRIANDMKNPDKAGHLISNYHTERNASTDTGYIIMDMLNGKVNGNPKDNETLVIELLDKHFSNEAAEYVKKLIEYKLIVVKDGKIVVRESKLDKRILSQYNNVKDMTDFVKSYLVDYAINMGSFATLTVGDPAFYSEKVKNGKVVVDRIVDYFKRAKEIFSPKSIPDLMAEFQVINEDGTLGEKVSVNKSYNSIYLKDEKIAAPSFDAIKEMLDANVEAKVISREDADKIISNYNEVNHADAQAFITPQFYRMTMIAHGRWNHALQKAYDNAMAGKVNLEDLEIFQPIKPFMYNNEYNAEYGVMMPVQNKNSEFVLFPKLVENNPRLKALYDHMQNNDIDIANFESAVKAGLHDVISMEDIENGAIPVKIKLNTLHRGIQQETPEHHVDSTGKYGSQPRKLIIADLDPNVMYEVNGWKSMSAKEIVSRYQSIIAANLKESYGDVLDEFTTDGNLDWKKISTLLRVEMESSLMSEDFINAIQVHVDGNRLKIPLFDELIGGKIESIITSKWRNGVTNQKINQMALIQTASVGLAKNLKLVFKSQQDRENYEKDLAESEKIITFAKLDEAVRELLTKKGYTNELWNTLTEEEKEHAIKCATV